MPTATPIVPHHERRQTPYIGTRVESATGPRTILTEDMGATIPLEEAIVKRIMRRLQIEPGCHAIKIHGEASGTRGTPDILGSYCGRSFVLEVKRPEVGVVSESQKYQLQRWANAGAITAVVESVEDVIELLGFAR